MQTTVKRWFTDKGYGFLHNGGDAPDIMVHANELKNCQYLRPGRTVEFECHTNSKGLVAKNVRLVQDQPKAHNQRHSQQYPFQRSGYGRY